MSENKLTGALSGRAFFEKRVGLRWQVWFEHRDGTVEPNGASQWLACPVLYWRRLSAMRAANSMWAAYNAGVWCAEGRAAAHTPSIEQASS